jgi:SAM-dependent methyltransferase
LRAVKVNPYDLLRDGARVLDVGAKQKKGTYWKGAERLRLINLDLVPAPGLDLAADAHALPLADASVDAVLCVSVLMYTRNPAVAVAEMLRVLKPGGVIYMNAPWVYRTAPDGDDLFRFSVAGLRILGNGFQEISAGFNRGPASTMADLLSHFFATLTCFNNRALYGVLVDVYQWIAFPLKFLDSIVGRYDNPAVIYSGAFFLGKKLSATSGGDVYVKETS